MRGALIPPVTYEEFRSQLFQETFPVHRFSDHIEVMWRGEDLWLNWYGLSSPVDLLHAWDYRQADSTPLEVLQAWAEDTIQPNVKEVMDAGFPVFNPVLKVWEYGVYRSGTIRLLPNDLLRPEDVPALKKSCSGRLEVNQFQVSQTDAILTITSCKPHHVPPCAVVFQAELLSEVLEPFYDVTDKTRILLSADTALPVFVGHANAINRLSDGIEDKHAILSLSDLETLG